MSSQNNKEGLRHVKAAIIGGVFALLAAIIGCGTPPLITGTVTPIVTFQPSLIPTSSSMIVITGTVVNPTESSPFEIAVININSEIQTDGTVKETANLSISPLGLGTLQLTSPSAIKLGESSIIRLAITPDSVLAGLPRVSAPTISANAPDYVLEFSDRLQIYPVMIAELKGVNFDIESDNRPEKPVTSNMPVEWIWNVTPKSGGKQTLILEISVPVIIDQIRNVISAQTLKNIPIEIQVEVTPTPIPSEIIVAVIVLIGVLAGVYITLKNAKKTKKEVKSVSRSFLNKSQSTSREKLITPRQIRILFLAADPTDSSRLRLGEESREIQEKLQLAKLRDRFDLQERLSVRPADISQAMLDIQPQIVHFSGHGTDTGALCFENLEGEAQLVHPDALAALFEQFANQVKCVLLNACYSEIQAKAIAKHIKYVIGMNQAIGDEAAIAFAVGFYQALGAGRTIEDSYKLGCVQIRLESIPEYFTPVLIRKEQIQP